MRLRYTGSMLTWFINVIRRDLGMLTTGLSAVWVNDCLWYLGEVSLNSWLSVPLFFARGLSRQREWEQVNQTLAQQSNHKKGVILTSIKTLPVGYRLPGEHKIVSLYDCLARDEYFHINLNQLKTKLGVSLDNPHCFSPDYRYARFGHVEFFFASMQAAFVELFAQRGQVA